MIQLYSRIVMISQTDEKKSRAAERHQGMDVNMLCQALNDLGIFTVMEDRYQIFKAF